jgi:uncharacterized membrane protein YidH (DUF202 family)
MCSPCIQFEENAALIYILQIKPFAIWRFLTYTVFVAIYRFHQRDTLAKQEEEMNKAKYYTFIAWIALSMFFLTQAMIGGFITFTGGDITPFEKVNLSTLIMIAAGAILLVEALMNFMERSGEDEETQQPDHVPVKPQLNFKSILMYIVLVVVILVSGLALRSILPVFRISPWVNLILAAVGFIGLKPLFLRKKRS